MAKFKFKFNVYLPSLIAFMFIVTGMILALKAIYSKPDSPERINNRQEVIKKDMDSANVMCGGRVKSFVYQSGGSPKVECAY